MINSTYCFDDIFLYNKVLDESYIHFCTFYFLFVRCFKQQQQQPRKKNKTEKWKLKNEEEESRNTQILPSYSSLIQKRGKKTKTKIQYLTAQLVVISNPYIQISESTSLIYDDEDDDDQVSLRNMTPPCIEGIKM